MEATFWGPSKRWDEEKRRQHEDVWNDENIEEVIENIRKLRNEKATGKDEITAEILKHMWKETIKELVELLNENICIQPT